MKNLISNNAEYILGFLAIFFVLSFGLVAFTDNAEHFKTIVCTSFGITFTGVLIVMFSTLKK